MKKFFKAIDSWFDKVISKGEVPGFFEYFIKYLVACGMAANLTFFLLILISIFT